MKTLFGIMVLVSSVLLAGCAAAPRDVTQGDIDALAQEIRALDPAVSVEEATRAADIAYTYSLHLAEEYNVTDSPIIHNAKVNNGWRERGICVHWAEDIEKRLNAEGFDTLQVHRAISDGRQIRIDHSTAIISFRGASLDEGIVLDPWRFGGVLYWAPTLADTRYNWEPQMTVLRRKYLEKRDRQRATLPE